MARSSIPKGIEVRHRSACKASGLAANCTCIPRVRATVYEPGGGRLRHVVDGNRPLGDRINEAQSWMRQKGAQLDKGISFADVGGTVQELCEQWLSAAQSGAAFSTRAQDGRYSIGYVVSVRSGFRANVYPRIGAKRAEDVTPAHLTAIVRQMLDDGRAGATVRACLLPLATVYAYALDGGKVTHNPALKLKLPPASRGRKARLRCASPSEAAKLIAALEPRDQALWGVAMYAGLRRGEALGLAWSNVELDNDPHIRVRDSAHPESGELRLDRVKTKAGQREVPIGPQLVSLLRHHRVLTGRREGLVFGDDASTVFSGSWSMVLKRARTAWRLAQLDRISFHECRHSFASFCIAAAARQGEMLNFKQLTEWMGHSSIAMTIDVYGHLYEGENQRNRGMLDAFWKEAM